MNSTYTPSPANGLRIDLPSGGQGDLSAIWTIEIASDGNDAIKLRLVDANADKKVAILETNSIEPGGERIAITVANLDEHAGATWRAFTIADTQFGLQADALRLCGDRISDIPGLLNILGKALAAWTSRSSLQGAVVCRHGDMGLAMHHPKLQRGTVAQHTIPNAANQQSGNANFNLPQYLQQKLTGAQAPSTPPTPAAPKSQPSAPVTGATPPAASPQAGGQQAPQKPFRPKFRKPNAALQQWF